MKSDYRFDVIYRGDRVSVDYHFCREWDAEGGCYGTNPHHGCSFEEAKASVAEWHEDQAKRWREMTYKKEMNEAATIRH
jgi:hypothetical protein